MRLSRWDPSTGIYDVYEAPHEMAAINDDLPIPEMPPRARGVARELGVPSVECGRPLPPGAVHIGRSEFPLGHVTPPAGVVLGATDAPARGSDFVAFLVGAAAVTAIWFVWGRK